MSKLCGLLVGGVLAVIASEMLTSGAGAADVAAVGAKVIAKSGRVVDGDTLYLEGYPTRFRLWGVDAPEHDDPHYRDATQALTSLVAGQVLTCAVQDVDPYGRPVASCTLQDGRDVGAILIAAGWVCDFAHFSRRAYRTGQNEARAGRKGVWADMPLPAQWAKRCTL